MVYHSNKGELIQEDSSSGWKAAIFHEELGASCRPFIRYVPYTVTLGKLLKTLPSGAHFKMRGSHGRFQTWARLLDEVTHTETLTHIVPT